MKEPLRKPCQCIAVCGAKGGAGRTSLAVNLAVTLAKQHKDLKIGIWDADFQFGNVNMAMNLLSTLSIKEAVDAYEHLDRLLLSRYLLRHESGVRVLAAPPRPEYAELITLPLLDKVMGLLAEELDYLIIDTPAGFQETTLFFMERAASILMVTTPELNSLVNTKAMTQTLEVLGLKKQMKVVLNRAGIDSVLQPSQMADVLQANIDYTIPDQWGTASKAIDLGIPFTTVYAGTELSRAYLRLAEGLHTGVSERDARGSLLARMVSLWNRKVTV
ncbi:AAA family ATPase [Paenibacillus sp.]|uniref:AAA family ATPase n=1 Tax=Paenibacillus sp. TaxID=58172 RepID=UPI002D3DC792|nr:P-loop NTPase [Paenibacillus sp.]HZG84285.1 P-loop NTPase [Paenibacillus sp.]